MRARHLIIRTASFLSLALLALSTPRFVAAKELTGMVRTFGFYATGATEAPSFVNENSLGVVVLPSTPGDSPSTIEFSLVSNNGPLAGMTWASQPAQHITKGANSGGGAFFWLLSVDTPTPPPAGSVAFTSGPLASVLSSESGRIALCNGDCSGDDNIRWRVVDVGGTPFVIVTAVFSK